MTNRVSRQKHRLLVICLALARANGFQASLATRGTRRLRPSLVDGLLFSRSEKTASRTVATEGMVARSTDANLRDLGNKIVQLGRRGNTDEALAIYYTIDRPSIRLMNGAIDACSRARPTRLQQAFDLFQAETEKHNLKPNVFTFGVLMNACNRDRNSSKALKLLNTMQESYGVIPNVVVYSAAISACARSKPPEPEQALRLLREAVEEREQPMNVVGFNAAISACAQAGDWENAISLLTRMEDATANSGSSYLVPAPDFVTYGTVLAACEKGEQWKLVLKYAAQMEKNSLELDGLAVTSCLHACQQMGLADEAIRYLTVMKNIHPVLPQTAKLQRSGARQPLRGPDAVAYRLAISACARGGAWKEGIRLLEDFKAETGAPADVMAYTAAITGCEYAGRWKAAFFLLDKMRKEGVDPNEVTVAAVIGACATACANQGKEKTSDGSDMLLPQKKALQLLNILKRHDNFVSPNIQVYNAAIRTCAEAGDVKQAFKLLEEIEEAGIERTEITYGSLMTACERVGCVESASQVFRKLKDDGFVPNEIIYGAAISCCRKARQSERALLLLRKMLKEELTPNVATFNTVMVAQAEGRTKADTERAIVVYKLMKSDFATEKGRPNRQTYTIIVNFFASKMQPITAEAFLKKMREDGFKPDVDLFTATVAAYERTGQPLRALQVMESMQKDGYDFYGVKVLNSAFKNAVKLANKVGQNFSAREESPDEEKTLKLIEVEMNDENLI